MYIFIAILIFGVLIATHELGHFLTAKTLGVKVNEFAVGMGPAIWKRERGETLYSLRLLPIGGYCAMEGENDDSADEHSFGRAATWKKVCILTAGAAMNFVTGFLLILILFSQVNGFPLPAVGGLIEGYGLEESGLQAGDVVLSIDGHAMYTYDNLSFYLGRAGDTVDWVVKRDGVRVVLDELHMPRQERVDADGNKTYLRGLNLGVEVLPPTVANKLLYSWYGALDFVRLVWVSLGDLISGAVGLRDLTGPVGIVDTMTEVGNQSKTPVAAAQNLAYFAALIAVNLAVMNLLPLPALDGGRIFFLLINGLSYLIFRKKIKPEFEGYIHIAGLVALMALMLLVTMSDIGKLMAR